MERLCVGTSSGNVRTELTKPLATELTKPLATWLTKPLASANGVKPQRACVREFGGGAGVDVTHSKCSRRRYPEAGWPMRRLARVAW